MPSLPEENRPAGDELPVWRRPPRSLPTRISFFVLGATLVTSLAITAISLVSIDAFLRDKIEQKFPSILANRSAQLDLWYQQRALALELYSKRISQRGELDAFFSGTSQADSAHQQLNEQLSQQLADLLRSSPRYRALFLTNPEGDIALWVGERENLPRSVHESFSAVSADENAAKLSDVWLSNGVRDQIASVGIDLRTGRAAGLHALLSLDELDRILSSQNLSSSGRVYLVGPEGRYLAASSGEFQGRSYEHTLPGPDPGPGVSEYTTPRGERMLSSAASFPRFGWSLVVEEPYGDAFAPVTSAIRRILGINLAIVGVLSLIAFRVSVNMVRPIEALSQTVRRISDGQIDVEIPPVKSQDEVGVLTGAFREMTTRLAANARELERNHSEIEAANESLRAKNDELKRVNEILEQLSITDGLTHLYNHRFFQDFLAKETNRVDRTEEPLALILIDIDHFKHWNDQLGHAAGDEILRKIAGVMAGLIRDSDLLARYGGEEFALVAPGTDIEGAMQIAEKMRSEVSQTSLAPASTDAHRHVTISVGVAIYHGDRKALFSEADHALYRAKAAGRDCVMIVEPGDSQP